MVFGILHIKKPAPWGDKYWCFRNFCHSHASSVNHPGQFTDVDVGKVGCVGDAFSYAKISLRRHIVVGSWRQGNVQDFDGTTVRSYIFGDSTYPSSGAIAAEVLQRASISTSNTIQ